MEAAALARKHRQEQSDDSDIDSAQEQDETDCLGQSALGAPRQLFPQSSMRCEVVYGSPVGLARE